MTLRTFARCEPCRSVALAATAVPATGGDGRGNRAHLQVLALHRVSSTPAATPVSPETAPGTLGHGEPSGAEWQDADDQLATT
jgi:hypothetical protein